MTDQLSLTGNDRDLTDDATQFRGVLTNRWNLLEFLSRRLITPFGTVPKYYDDLLRLTPGLIPVVRTPLSEELVSASVAADDPTIFPVFLEVDDTVSDSPLLIETIHVVRLHFRSQRDLDEHADREFDNIPSGPPLVVTPSVFTGGAMTVADLPRASRVAKAGVAKRLTALDKYTGGVCVAAAVGEGGAADAEAIARLVDGDGWRDASAPWLELAAADAHGTPPPANDSLNTRLFDALYRRLVSIDTLGDPIRFVRSINRQLRDDPEREELTPALKRIVDILDGEAEFGRFKPKGSAVVKALLLLALRPDPEALVAWSAAETGADTETRLTALFLSGVLHGRSVLGLGYRPEPLDLVLAHLEASRALGNDDVSRCTVTDQKDSHRVMCNGSEVATLTAQPIPLAALLAEADLEKPELAEACARLAAHHGWSDIVTTIVEAPEGFFVTSDVHIKLAGFPAIRRRVDRDGLLERVAEPAIGLGPEADSLRALLEQAGGPETAADLAVDDYVSEELGAIAVEQTTPEERV